MRIGKSTLIWNMYPPEIKDKCVDRAINEMLFECKQYCRLGAWYKVRIDQRDEIDSDEYSRVDLIMEFDEIPEQTFLIKTREQICLLPTQSLRQKLKNCYKYLSKRGNNDFGSSGK